MNVPRLVFRLLLGRRLPTTSGDIEVPDLKRPVLIRRDGYGIPYVEAEEEEDGWYGLGFCQGQDRTFQLGSLLRVSRGTVAELIGPKGLAIDRLSRRIGFLDSAPRQMPALDPAIRSVLEAFARGLTDGSRLGCKRVPHEFTLLRARPTPFAAVDLVAMGKLQAFALPSNWDVELARLQIMKMDGPEALAALGPRVPGVAARLLATRRSLRPGGRQAGGRPARACEGGRPCGRVQQLGRRCLPHSHRATYPGQ